MLDTPAASLGWTVLTGFMLMALPVSAVSTQAARLAKGEALVLPVEIMNFQNDNLVPMVEIETPIQAVELTQLSGDNNFAPNQAAFLFMKKSGVTWYPYAILKNAPVNSSLSEDTVMLRARVREQIGTQLRLAFSFDKVSPQQSFMRAIMEQPTASIALGLALSGDGRGSASALYVDQVEYDQRVTLKSVLFGRKNTSANKAPPT